LKFNGGWTSGFGISRFDNLLSVSVGGGKSHLSSIVFLSMQVIKAIAVLVLELQGLQNPRMIFSEKVRGTHLLRKNHPLNQQYRTSVLAWAFMPPKSALIQPLIHDGVEFDFLKGDLNE
jgi:hypothetical protein